MSSNILKRCKSAFNSAKTVCPECGSSKCKPAKGVVDGNFYECEKCNMLFNKVPPAVPGLSGMTY
jgi:hypothetical protein